jgi:hypothetical protein
MNSIFEMMKYILLAILEWLRLDSIKNWILKIFGGF